ncbi:MULTISPECIES: hypothetical protein [unclassified Variovorax]|uniref:hypothetical protein n=1 Tax=unclassified Variovorax TaxID=663243 RepID=UPI00076DB16D|nr:MULTISPECIES: hypothetical protein [unclassified Variovorax]KWT73304.1 hypothetical protein APY03_5919 [Variovorax sp. WDL1]PNG47163.1 hypothetical protein CHC06_07511 [Variovorax sp. B2]PNG48186.1 hypothetical protein CHC07_07357 [Variovorax sp. B4]VTV15039.1 hypothetical protein WDL1CHR_05486 [Variovorax sp. WDL1]
MNTRRSAFLVAAALIALQGASGPALGTPLPVLAPGAHASGGVSYEGQQEMQANQDLYNLRLTFAEAQTGAYLAGVTVIIEPANKSAPLGPFTDCGPLFYVALSPGVYRVVASYAGLTRSKTIRVGKTATQATLYWPAASEL